MRQILPSLWCLIVGHRWGPWAGVPLWSGIMVVAGEDDIQARYCGRCRVTELRAMEHPEDTADTLTLYEVQCGDLAVDTAVKRPYTARYSTQYRTRDGKIVVARETCSWKPIDHQ